MWYGAEKWMKRTSIVKLPIVVCGQVIHGPIWPTHPRRVDGQDWPSPATYPIIRPHLGYLICRLLCDQVVHGGRVGQKSFEHVEAAGIAVKGRVIPPRGVEALIDSV